MENNTQDTGLMLLVTAWVSFIAGFLLGSSLEFIFRNIIIFN